MEGQCGAQRGGVDDVGGEQESHQRQSVGDGAALNEEKQFNLFFYSFLWESIFTCPLRVVGKISNENCVAVLVA